MALIYFAYKVLTFQFCEIFCMNGNKSSLLSSPQILGNYFARRKILAETFELSVSAKFPLSWIPPKVRACKKEDKHISQDLAVSMFFYLTGQFLNSSPPCSAEPRLTRTLRPRLSKMTRDILRMLLVMKRKLN